MRFWIKKVEKIQKFQNGLDFMKHQRQLVDRRLKNGKRGFKMGQSDEKKYLVDYRKGKYVIIDLTLKKRGHSQKFK